MYEEQQPQEQRPDLIPLPRKPESDATTRWKIEPEEVIKETIHNLNGDRFDSWQGRWVINKDPSKKLCNNGGQHTFETHLRGVLNKNIILSNLSEDMIKKMALENSFNVIDLLETSWDKFDVKKENLSMILQLMDFNVYCALQRAKDGFFVDHLSTTQRHIEQSSTVIQERQKENRKMIPNLFGWGKGGGE